MLPMGLHSTESIHGAVKTGTDRKFLKLKEFRLSFDQNDYYINEVDQILGILLVPLKIASVV